MGGTIKKGRRSPVAGWFLELPHYYIYKMEKCIIVLLSLSSYIYTIKTYRRPATSDLFNIYINSIFLYIN